MARQIKKKGKVESFIAAKFEALLGGVIDDRVDVAIKVQLEPAVLHEVEVQLESAVEHEVEVQLEPAVDAAVEGAMGDALEKIDDNVASLEQLKSQLIELEGWVKKLADIVVVKSQVASDGRVYLARPGAVDLCFNKE